MSASPASRGRRDHRVDALKPVTSFFTSAIELLRLTWPELTRPGRETRGRFALAMVLLVATVLARTATPILFSNVVDTLASTEPSAARSVILLVAAYVGVWLASESFRVLRQVAILGPLERTVQRVVRRAFAHTLKLPLGEHIDQPIGALTNSVTRAQDAIPAVLYGVFLQLIPTAVEVLLAAIVLGTLFGWLYGLVVALVFIAHLTFTERAMRIVGEQQRQGNESKNAANARVVEALLHVETIKALHGEAYEERRVGDLLSVREKLVARMHVSNDLVSLGQSVIIGLGLAALTTAAALEVAAGTVTVGDFVIVHGYLLQFVAPLGALGSVVRSVRRGLIDSEDLLALLEHRVESPPAASGSEPRALPAGNGRIRFRDVCFSYAQEGAPAFEGLDFEVPAGRRVMLVGPSGSGKTTLIRLLLRLYDVSDGAIEIDGQDIRGIDHTSLREAVGVVPQDIALFDDTLAANIAYGQPSAPRQDIRDAALAAQLGPLLDRLPEGLDTQVGQRGARLSGGERQRVAIARALLTSPRLLVLDEAMSALDANTESDVLRTLLDLSEERTILLSTHRLDAASEFDEIIVLDACRIVERGGFDDLIARHGAFRALWDKRKSSDVG